jgi:hypothetical protein
VSLHVWHDGYDWVVAESAEDAVDVECDITSNRLSDYDPDEWQQLPDDKPLKIVDWDGNGTDREQPCAAWVAENGRGFLCSTEY